MIARLAHLAGTSALVVLALVSALLIAGEIASILITFYRKD